MRETKVCSEGCAHQLVLGLIGAAHKCSQILHVMDPTSNQKHLYGNMQLIILLLLKALQFVLHTYFYRHNYFVRCICILVAYLRCHPNRDRSCSMNCFSCHAFDGSIIIITTTVQPSKRAKLNLSLF